MSDNPQTKEEVVQLLKRSVEEWNAWRRKNPYIPRVISEIKHEFDEPWNVYLAKNEDIRPDLTYVDLRGANLNGANLVWAKLNGANLRGAYLNEAKLASADLRDVDLREARPIMADLKGADLSGADLTGANLMWADLSHAKLSEAKLTGANLGESKLMGADFSGADLSGAYLREADLTHADLREADLREADLREVDLREADLSGANLTGVDLMYASLVRTCFEKADLSGCKVYGISAWDLKLDGAIQAGLIVTDEDQPAITVSDLEVAQFIYLLVFNPKIRKVIDTVTSKVVLILGRFTDERKKVLEAMRETMQHRDLVPIIFDFDKPASRDLTETVTTLAHLARFIVADITDPKSIPQELTAIIPDLPSVPVQTVILASENEYAMYERWKRYQWVLPIFRYNDPQHLLTSLDESVIGPAAEAAEKARR